MTQSRWEMKLVAGGDYENLLQAPDGRCYDFGGSDTGYAHAKRLMECANACAGIPTAALEDGVLGEVIEALKGMLYCPRCEGTEMQHVPYGADIEKAHAALAKLKGDPTTKEPVKRGKNYCIYCEIEHRGGC